jgi:hypothetical protein
MPRMSLLAESSSRSAWERSGCCSPLLRGEGLTDAQPSEGEFHGGRRGAESLGGGAFELGGRRVRRRGCGPARGERAGRGLISGCSGNIPLWAEGNTLSVAGSALRLDW